MGGKPRRVDPQLDELSGCDVSFDDFGRNMKIVAVLSVHGDTVHQLVAVLIVSAASGQSRAGCGGFTDACMTIIRIELDLRWMYALRSAVEAGFAGELAAINPAWRQSWLERTYS